jgi:hypothetical protein
VQAIQAAGARTKKAGKRIDYETSIACADRWWGGMQTKGGITAETPASQQNDYRRLHGSSHFIEMAAVAKVFNF